jgi:hypothetical protein
MKLAVPYIRAVHPEPAELAASEHTVELLQQIDALLAEPPVALRAPIRRNRVLTAGPSPN